jgi:hypothetical protein
MVIHERQDLGFCKIGLSPDRLQEKRTTETSIRGMRAGFKKAVPAAPRGLAPPANSLVFEAKITRGRSIDRAVEPKLGILGESFLRGHTSPRPSKVSQASIPGEPFFRMTRPDGTEKPLPKSKGRSVRGPVANGRALFDHST